MTSQWIKCNEKLPPTKKLVLVLVKNQLRPSEFVTYQSIGFYTNGNEVDYDPGSMCNILNNCQLCERDATHYLGKGWYHEINCGQCEDGFDSLSVTHWMPLPNPPSD